MKNKVVLMLILAMAMGCGLTQGQLAPPPVQGPDTNAPAPSTNAPAIPAVELPPVGHMQVAAVAPSEAPAAASDELIEVEIKPSTTLPDAVQLLARLAKINYQFDPRLLGQTRADGTPIPAPTVGVEICWSNVTAAEALGALLDNYNWQMIQDDKTRIARITAREAPGVEPMVMKVIQLKYSSPTNLFMQLTNALPSKACRLIPDARTSQLVVIITARDLPAMEAVIERLDQPTGQILIEGRLFETTQNPKSLKGVDWTDTLEGQNVTFGNGVTSGTSTETTSTAPGSTSLNGRSYASGQVTTATGSSTLTTTVGNGGLSADTARGFHPSTAFLNADGVHAVISFLNTDTETKSLALPRTVAQDGAPTELAVIRNVPIFEQDQSAGVGGQNNLATLRPNYERKVGDTIINEVGVKLKVTPRIVGATNVLLDLKPEISAQELVPASMKLNGQVNESPIFSRRRISTLATVPSGYTLVLGGLRNDTSSQTFTKVPLLGDIPGIGLLFRHEDKERTKQNLIIFVTPTIIEGADFQATKTQFLKTKIENPDDSEESAWNSGKPKDWTKPKPAVAPIDTTAPDSAR